MAKLQQKSEEIRDIIRKVGLRATPARLQTYEVLRQSGMPMTHAEVTERLEPKGIDKATVFRNLNNLVDAGLLRKTELGDRVWRFEVADLHAHSGGIHPHFLCIDCGTVACMSDVKLTASSQRESEKFGDVTEILLRGHCRDCSTAGVR